MNEPQKPLPIGAGKGSFDLIEPGRFFRELPLKKGDVLLDMGCGQGNYALALSGIVGEKGLIYAIDLWEEGIRSLQEQIFRKGIRNIIALLADIRQKIPLGDRSVDVCLMAAVLHDLVQIQGAEGALQEAARVLKPGGVLAIVEFKKMEGPPGPPLHSRLAPEEVEKIVAPRGFRKERMADLGPYLYMIKFSRRPG